MAWPDSHLHRAKSNPELFDRFLQKFKTGVRVFTQFSGMGGPELGLDLLSQSLERNLSLQPGSTECIGFRVVEAGDKALLCQRVLKGFHPRCRAKHVFGDVFDRMDKRTCQLLAEAASSKDMTKEAMNCSYTKMVQVLEDRSEALFLPGHTAFCAVHGKQCKLYDEELEPGDTDTVFRCGWMGTPCLDDTTMGDRAGSHGPQVRLVLATIHEIRKRLLTVVFHECTPDFDPGIFVTHLGDLYEVLIISIVP